MNEEQQQNEEQEQNEEQKWMNNFNQHHKNLTGGSSKQSNIAGLFHPPVKKNDYRSVINIAFISNIVLHMVAI